MLKSLIFTKIEFLALQNVNFKTSNLAKMEIGIISKGIF